MGSKERGVPKSEETVSNHSSDRDRSHNNHDRDERKCRRENSPQIEKVRRVGINRRDKSYNGHCKGRSSFRKKEEDTCD